MGHASAWAAVDLSDSPLVSGVSKPVPPNIYFILDDSTSMSWDYMPDDVDDATTAKVEPVAFTSLTSRDCFKNFGYNKIYYNPNITYVGAAQGGWHALTRTRTSRTRRTTATA